MNLSPKYLSFEEEVNRSPFTEYYISDHSLMVPSLSPSPDENVSILPKMTNQNQSLRPKISPDTTPLAPRESQQPFESSSRPLNNEKKTSGFENKIIFGRSLLHRRQSDFKSPLSHLFASPGCIMQTSTNENIGLRNDLPKYLSIPQL